MCKQYRYAILVIKISSSVSFWTFSDLTFYIFIWWRTDFCIRFEIELTFFFFFFFIWVTGILVLVYWYIWCSMSGYHIRMIHFLVLYSVPLVCSLSIYTQLSWVLCFMRAALHFRCDMKSSTPQPPTRVWIPLVPFVLSATLEAVCQTTRNPDKSFHGTVLNL